MGAGLIKISADQEYSIASTSITAHSMIYREFLTTNTLSRQTTWNFPFVINSMGEKHIYQGEL